MPSFSSNCCIYRVNKEKRFNEFERLDLQEAREHPPFPLDTEGRDRHKQKKMKADNLIALRFMSLIGHLIIVINILWSRNQIVHNCVNWDDGDPTYDDFRLKDIEVTVALSLMIIFTAVELLGFFSGISTFTPFHSFVSFLFHCFACISLGTFLMENWDCFILWPVLTFFSVVPAVSEVCICIGYFLRKTAA